MQGCTVVGKIHTTLFNLVSDSIVRGLIGPNDTWAAPLWADRKQQGCVRLSYLPAGSDRAPAVRMRSHAPAEAGRRHCSIPCATAIRGTENYKPDVRTTPYDAEPTAVRWELFISCWHRSAKPTS